MVFIPVKFTALVPIGNLTGHSGAGGAQRGRQKGLFFKGLEKRRQLFANCVVYYTKFGKQITQFRDFPGHFHVASAYFISYITMFNLHCSLA